ncbi:MAG: squalene/phytoene synthase family protein [Hyphomicrobiaceae bacterium]|nr:squalene/phytoene synthase family protein [Hyphomicrobiaceae bacterium]
MVDLPSQDRIDAEDIRQRARQTNYDWYLAALLAPRAARADLLVLAAFSGEVARIPSAVSEPMMGAIRLQWWRDVLDQPAGATIGHPLADALRELIARHRLTKAHLHAQIDAAEQALQSEPFEDRAALSNHFGKAWGSRFRLAAECLRGTDELVSRDAIFCAAEAYGCARLAAWTAAAKASGGDIASWLHVGAPGSSRGSSPASPHGASSAIEPATLATEATASLTRLRQLWGAVPRPQRPAFLPAAIVEPYLRVSQGPARGDEPIELARAWRLLVANWRGVV